MLLNSGTLGMGHTEGTFTITMTELGQYDNNESEDIIYVLSAGTTLQSVQSSMGMLITNGTFTTDGYEMDINGTLDIEGTLNAVAGAGGNSTIDVGGAWDMTGGVFSSTNSTVLFTGTSGTATFDIISDSKSFYNVKFDDSGGGTTWEIEDFFGVDGTFFLADGIFDTNASEDNPMTIIGTFQINGGTMEFNYYGR